MAQALTTVTRRDDAGTLRATCIPSGRIALMVCACPLSLLDPQPPRPGTCPLIARALLQADLHSRRASRAPAASACAAAAACLLCGIASAFSPGDVVTLTGGYDPNGPTTPDVYLVVRCGHQGCLALPGQATACRYCFAGALWI